MRGSVSKKRYPGRLPRNAAKYSRQVSTWGCVSDRVRAFKASHHNVIVTRNRLSEIPLPPRFSASLEFLRISRYRTMIASA